MPTTPYATRPKKASRRLCLYFHLSEGFSNTLPPIEEVMGQYQRLPLPPDLAQTQGSALLEQHRWTLCPQSSKKQLSVYIIVRVLFVENTLLFTFFFIISNFFLPWLKANVSESCSYTMISQLLNICFNQFLVWGLHVQLDLENSSWRMQISHKRIEN